MKNAARKLTVALSVVIAMGTVAAKGEAANHFAKIQIHNSSNEFVTYAYCWDNSENWKTVSLAPGATHHHYWTYGYANQNHSPRLFVKFDANRTHSDYIKTYNLPLYAVPSLDYAGRVYHFRYTDYASNWLDLRFLN